MIKNEIYFQLTIWHIYHILIVTSEEDSGQIYDRVL